MPADITTNLFARWKLNGDANDSSGNGHNGTLQGTAAFVSGGRTGGQCLSTVNANDFVSFGTGDPGNTFSFGGWVKWNGVSSAVQVLLCKVDTFAGGDMKWQTFFAPGTNQIGANGSGQTGATWSNSDTEDLVPQADRWEHVFFVFSSNAMTLYRNGVAIATRTYTLGSDNAATIKLGANGANAFQWEGFFEDWWVFSRALTAEDVIGVMNAGDIVVESPMWRQVVNRDPETLLGDIPISGYYDTSLGTPTDIQAKVGAGDYASLDDLVISSGTFSGTLSGIATGVADLTVKRTDTDATCVVEDVGVGRVFVIAGQSNAAGEGTNNQVYSGTIACSLFTEEHSTWRPLTDPTNFDVQSGSIWPLLANNFDAADNTCPIAFICTADGGTGIVSDGSDPTSYAWNKALSGASYTNMTERVDTSGANSIEAVLWHHGEAEVYEGHDPKDYYAATVAFIENVHDDLPGSPPVYIAQLGQVTNDVIANLDGIRHKQPVLWKHPYARRGPTFYDLDLSGGDSLHLKADAELQEGADRWFDCIETAGPPVMLRAKCRPGSTTITIDCDQTLASATLGTGAFTVTGDVDGARTVSGATAAGKKITLTIDAARKHGESLTVLYASENDGQGVTIPTADATSLPLAAMTLDTLDEFNPRLSPIRNPITNPLSYA